MCSIIPVSSRVRNTFAENSSNPNKEWRGRSRTGRGNTWLPNHIWDSDMPIQLKTALATMASNVHNDTLSIRLGKVEAAVMFGKSRSQAARYLEALEKEWGNLTVIRGETDEYGGYKANLYILDLSPKKRPQDVPKSVDSESKNDPTPHVMDESRLLIKNLSLSTEEQLHTPAIAEVVCVDFSEPKPTQEPPRPEPQRPIPDPEVWQAEQEALRQRREQRSARKAVARQAHYARAKAAPRLEGRSRRHHEPPTPVQEAAGDVLQLNGVAVPNYSLRRATEAAVELYSRREGLRPKLCVERMVLAWATYQRDYDVIIGAVGMERFYGEGVWCNPKGWRYDHEALSRARRF